MRLCAAILSSLLAVGCASTPEGTPPPPPAKPPVEVTPMVGAGSILYVWTQIVPGPALARAVVEGSGQPCPEIRLDELSGVAMTPNPAQGADAITVCEHPLVLPDGRPVSRAQVADRLLPLPGSTPERIAVIGDGDSGDGDGEWPLAQIAKTVARRQSPTLVVYVGERGCGESDWKSRQEGFFQPADELLQVAPWLVPGSCGSILAASAASAAAAESDPALPASAMVRVYRDLLEAAGAPGFLMLVRDPDAGTWKATFSTPKGDETRTCRLLGGAFDCS